MRRGYNIVFELFSLVGWNNSFIRKICVFNRRCVLGVLIGFGDVKKFLWYGFYFKEGFNLMICIYKKNVK